ncbi:MAG: type IX secretion system membrane protein PorP/SprF [Cytophagaceae bacterium]
MRLKIQAITLLFIISVGGLFNNNAVAQDIQFSQFYNVPLYLNPAFAGSAHGTRVGFNQRLQWPKVDGKYISSYLGIDSYFPEYKSGVGVYFLQDFQGSNNISSSQASLVYSYQIHLSEQLIFRPALEVGLISRSVNYSQLKFPQEFNDTTGYRKNSSLDMANPRKTFTDIGSGGMLYTKSVWFGFSFHHLNQPNQSMFNTKSKLPIKGAFVAGYKIDLTEKSKYSEEEKEFSITPTVHYKFQGQNDQVDFGLYVTYNYFVVGGWYRGIPTKRYERRFHNNESAIILLGFSANGFKFGYTYDFVTSKLAVARTGGAHEINLTYVFQPPRAKKRKPMRRMPCPSF